MTNNEYQALNSISASMLKTAQKSMKHFWSEYIDPNRKPKEQTKAMEFGSWLHDHILGTKEYDFLVVPEGIDRRTKEGKAFFSGNVEFETKRPKSGKNYGAPTSTTRKMPDVEPAGSSTARSISVSPSAAVTTSPAGTKDCAPTKAEANSSW